MGGAVRAARAAVAVVAVLGGAACAPGPSGVAVAGAVPRCEDVPAIAAPADWYRATPVYVANEMPVEEVRAWAAGRPGFEDLWIDRDHQGWITVAFSADAAARQAELVQAFPGAGVVAVELRHGRAALDALAERVRTGAGNLEIRSIGTLVDRDVVSVGLDVLDAGRVARLAAAFPAEPLCVEGLDPAAAPDPGAQQGAGDGWRLLGHADPAGPGYRTGIAADEAGYAALWAEAELPGGRPEVDFDAEIVIWFGAVTGSSCPRLRLDGVVVDLGRTLVHADIVNAEVVTACTDDIHPHSFVVALARERLPAGPFAIQLGAEDPPAGAPEERTVVDADLSVPGSVPGPGDIHADPALIEPDPGFVTPGDIVEPGFEPPFRFPVACGVTWVGPLNGTWWRTTDPEAGGGRLPDAWAGEVEGDGTLTAAISITGDGGPGRPATLVATVGGRPVRYVAVAGEPACP